MSGTIARQTLSNGLTVVAERRGLGPVVFSGVVYRVGSRDERPGFTGISHLLEHMMFKGTEKYGKGEVAAIVERNGGELNAFTTEDVTMYYEVFARDRWPLALDIESERMANLRVDGAELESERQVVLEERSMYRDIPAVELSEELQAATIRESPYRWPIIGWESDIRAITRDDVLEYYGRYYAPDNAALIVVGDVEPDEVFRLAEERFGAIPSGPGVTRRIPQEPPLRGATRLELARQTNLPQLQVMFRAPALRSAEAEALSLLTSVLSGTRTSRLDLALLETNLAGDVHVQFHAKQDPSVVTVFVEGQSGVPIEDVEAVVWRELERLGKEEVTEDELDRARNQTEAYHVISRQSPSNRGFTLGWHEAHGDVSYADDLVERLRGRTPAELRETAASVFRPDACGVARLLPVAAGNGGGGTPVAAPALFPRVSLHGFECPRRRFRSGLEVAPDIRRRTLDNGMRLLLQPDRTDPVVSVSLLFEGGAILDPGDRQGLASLTADVVERGPAGTTFVEHSRRFERLGSHLSLDAGSELVHVQVTLLSRHAATGLELVADVLEDPGLREEDLEIERQLALNDLEARADDLDDVAEDLFLPALADGHPYARLPHGNTDGVRAISVDDIRAFQPEAFRPDRAHLSIVGDLDESRIGPILERFARLPVPGLKREPVPALPLERVEQTRVATRSDKAQAKIWWGGRGLDANDPDRFATVAFNHVLGGSAIRSRLGDSIRDQQGLAYSVGSRHYARSRGGFFLVSMGTGPANVARAVDAIRSEVTRLAAEGPTGPELDDARDYLTGSFPLRFTTYGRLARFWTRSSYYGWPEDYLRTYPERIRALTGADLQRAGERLAGAAGTLAVAGPVDHDLAPVEEHG